MDANSSANDSTVKNCTDYISGEDCLKCGLSRDIVQNVIIQLVFLKLASGTVACG